MPYAPTEYTYLVQGMYCSTNLHKLYVQNF